MKLATRILMLKLQYKLLILVIIISIIFFILFIFSLLSDNKVEEGLVKKGLDELKQQDENSQIEKDGDIGVEEQDDGVQATYCHSLQGPVGLVSHCHNFSDYGHIH